MPREVATGPSEAIRPFCACTGRALWVQRGDMAPERPLSPPQGQRRAPRAPLPSTPVAAGALCRGPSPQRLQWAAGSGTHPGAVGPRLPSPTQAPLPPLPSAHPAPWPRPHSRHSPWRGTPASTASPNGQSPLKPLHLARAPAPAGRRCAGPAAGTSSHLLSCNSQQRGQPDPTLAAQHGYPKAAPLPFSFQPGWGTKGAPKPIDDIHTEQAIIYLVFNLFCHIFVKRQQCNKKSISTVSGVRAEPGRSPGGWTGWAPPRWGDTRPELPSLGCPPPWTKEDLQAPRAPGSGRGGGPCHAGGSGDDIYGADPTGRGGQTPGASVTTGGLRGRWGHSWPRVASPGQQSHVSTGTSCGDTDVPVHMETGLRAMGVG